MVIAETSLGETDKVFFAFNHVKPSNCTSFHRNTLEEVENFALQAKVILKSYLSCAAGPFLRVDIFEDQMGNLKLNEFESLEAMIDSKRKMQVDVQTGKRFKTEQDIDRKMSDFRRNYWLETILRLHNFVISKRMEIVGQI